MHEETSNVVQLFPDPTDAQYEELILPILVQVVGRISKDVDDGQVYAVSAYGTDIDLV